MCGDKNMSISQNQYFDHILTFLHPFACNSLVFLFFHRETLLGQLTVYIRQVKDDFNQRTVGGAASKDVPKGKNLPQTVNNVVWVRQLEAKVCLVVL